ncbi:MAG: valine--tRNA ligase [Flavobacteriales bacterium]|nr:valine--tRNA ligase [Flavobacteriales bacterium]
MDIASKYDPKNTEQKWYDFWIENRFFASKPDHRTPYTIVIPPPNVTGVLHMGHMLNNTIQDVLIRRARMRGYNACWVPGTDHASIATEAKVVRKLREEGIKKGDLSREEFMKHAWEWTHKHGGIILQQLKKLGASCDWDRTSFTMDEKYYQSVIDTFIDLHRKGKIYRGERMINWDPVAKTALSDEEVIYKEGLGKLYHVSYKVVGSDEVINIATTRPETILGDTAVCIHPNDDRYKHLHGKKVIVPLVNREVPIITDEYVDMEFGTGCLKVTPAHDTNDYDLGKKHQLEVINMMNDDGTVSEAGKLYIGMDRFDVRKQIVEDLKSSGNLIKVEDYQNKVGHSERTDAVIEPRLSLQWFVDMKDLGKPALDHVMNDDIKFYPPKFKNSYRNWMENIKDWCISRQLWWGHQIPAWYTGDGQYAVASSLEEAHAQLLLKNPSLKKEDLKQDPDVLDTWFSSWLWPISVFNGFYSKEEINYYYPTQDLVTAPEIMFFWVARMIIAGYEYMGEKPFTNVYYTGIVRDKQGRKMSKSLGNSPDPIDLIEEYGADGVRVGMLLTSPAGNDLPFDVSLCEQGRNFANKIWNAFRLVNGWESRTENRAMTGSDEVAIRWMKSRLQQVLEEIDDDYEKFRISEALMSLYKLVWDDFCSWYLEMIKPGFEQNMSRETFEATRSIFENLLKILHPFMPFLTEELWHHLNERKSADEAIVVSAWPMRVAYDKTILENFKEFEEIVTAIRNVRKTQNIPNKESITLKMFSSASFDSPFTDNIIRLCNISSIDKVNESDKSWTSFMVDSNEFFIPMSSNADMEAEKERIIKELDYTKGFLASVMKKLGNEKFVNSAPPAVVESENKKRQDAESLIRVLEEKLVSLG